MSVFSDNTERHRYELTASEGDSWADYRDVGGVRVILHVETPAEARRLGYASKLMEAIVGKALYEGTVDLTEALAAVRRFA